MFIASAAAAALTCLGSARAAGGDALDSVLKQLEADPGIVEDSWQFREHPVSRGVGIGTPSKRPLSPQVIDIITRFEVTSPSLYARRYTHPIWPKGKSGVTIGIGYDLAFANKAFLARDWPMLSASDRELLGSVLQLRGTAARDAVASVHAVEVPWAPARTQFTAFLPYPTAQTEAAFPNCDRLSDDSFGALVSLVFNRGSALPRNSSSRREMVEVHELMAARDYGKIPDRIRSMKRLWPSPDARGVVLRREAEALLFEAGLRRPA